MKKLQRKEVLLKAIEEKSKPKNLPRSLWINKPENVEEKRSHNDYAKPPKCTESFDTFRRCLKSSFLSMQNDLLSYYMPI